MKILRAALYIFIQCTWGAIQTLAGFVFFLINVRKKHYFYHGSIVTEWDSLSSVSLGMFLFVTKARLRDRRTDASVKLKETSRALLVHEYGHTIQSLVLGPFYLPVIGLPSLVWATASKPKLKRLNGAPYSAFWTEHSANILGEKVTKERSLENVVL